MVFASEINRFAAQTYAANHGMTPSGDITKIDKATIPDHDVLVAGFPCQAFSVMGKRQGMSDPRGMLYYEVEHVIDAKRPAAFILENVKGLVNHDNGRTFRTILRRLRSKGYSVRQTLLRASDFGVPQKRDRVYIVGFRNDLGTVEFAFPKGGVDTVGVGAILETHVAANYWLSPKCWTNLQARSAANASKGNGFRHKVLHPSQPANTLTVGGDGERNLVVDNQTPNGAAINADNVRRLTPRECARVQGYPDTFKIPVSDSQAYKQFGNAIAVPVVSAIAENLFAAVEATGKASWIARPAANDPVMDNLIDDTLPVRDAISQLDAAAAISADDQKKNGLGTTPAQIAEALSSMALPADSLVSLLDPACGRGSLPLAGVEDAARKTGSWTDAAHWAEQSLFGCDIDPVAVADWHFGKPVARAGRRRGCRVGTDDGDVCGKRSRVRTAAKKMAVERIATAQFGQAVIENHGRNRPMGRALRAWPFQTAPPMSCCVNR